MALVWISNYAKNFRRMDDTCWCTCTKDETVGKIFYLFHGNLKRAFKIMLSPEMIRI